MRSSCSRTSASTASRRSRSTRPSSSSRCNPDGYVIGDAILFFLDEELLNLVGRPSAHNWVQYHCETGGYDVDLRAGRALGGEPERPQGLPLPGPGADRARGAGEGHRRAAAGDQVLQHGLAHDRRATRCGRCITACPACPGSSSSGPLGHGEDVRAAIVEAGEEFGLRQVGSRVYATNTLESGWIPCPLPAVFTGDELKAVPGLAAGDGLRGHRLARRELLLRRHRGLLLDAVRARLRALREVRSRLHRSGSAREDGRQPARKKVTLAWNGEDVARAMGTMFQEDGPGEVHRSAALQLLDVAERQGA